LDEGFDTTALKDDNHHFGYKAFGGYQFNKYFALESGYFDLGRFGYTANTVPSGGLTGDAKFQGANLDAVVFLPFTEKFSAFGRFGYDYAYTKDVFVGYGSRSQRACRKLQIRFWSSVRIDPVLGYACRG
jgi:OOP family OmpA-OmpF porin